MKPATPSTSTGSYESKVPGTRLNPWDQHKLEQKYPTLTNDTSCDVCIIGAGLAGLSTAYRLVKAGKSVVVLESRVRGAGDTGRSVGLLSTWNNEYIREVERVCGANNARVSAEAHSAAISFINQVVKEENIKCGFEMVPGYLLSSSDQGHGMTSKHPSLSEEMEAAKRAGLDVKMEKLGSDSGFQPYGKVHSEALAFPLCANVHPLAYVEGLAAAIVKHGGQIFENTRAKGGVVTGPSKGRVKTMSGHTVTAREGVVMATRSPINRDQLWVHNRQLPQRLYTVALEVPEGAVKNAQYYDTSGKHLTYARLASNPSGKGKLLLVHGEGHKYGLGENKYEERDPWAALESWARQHFPACGAVQYCWSTMDYFPADLLGLYGQDPFDYSHPPNYILTGHNGQEWTGSTLGSEIIANTILKKPNPWAGTYNPSRVWAGATGKYAGELATYFSTVGVALVKHLVPRSLSDVAGMISPASVESKIMPGQGAVVQHGLRKKAMYRDNDGVLHMKSALCTHLGCCVAWNELDRTFDCPCHGSQYDACGRCIHAPAVADLEDLGTKM